MSIDSAGNFGSPSQLGQSADAGSLDFANYATASAGGIASPDQIELPADQVEFARDNDVDEHAHGEEAHELEAEAKQEEVDGRDEHGHSGGEDTVLGVDENSKRQGGDEGGDQGEDDDSSGSDGSAARLTVFEHDTAFEETRGAGQGILIEASTLELLDATVINQLIMTGGIASPEKMFTGNQRRKPSEDSITKLIESMFFRR